MTRVLGLGLLGAMGRKKSLSVSRGFEALHDPVASSDRLVRILRPIVEAFVLTMSDTGHDLALCAAIRAELVGDHDAQGPDVLADQFAQKTLGGGFVSVAAEKRWRAQRRLRGSCFIAEKKSNALR